MAWFGDVIVASLGILSAVLVFVMLRNPSEPPPTKAEFFEAHFGTPTRFFLCLLVLFAVGIGLVWVAVLMALDPFEINVGRGLPFHGAAGAVGLSGTGGLCLVLVFRSLMMYRRIGRSPRS